MIHMLSAFDLRPGEDEDAFRAAYDAFLHDLLQDDLIVSFGPIGTRVSATPMDTDRGRTQTRFTLLGFRDRAQLDAAYAFLASRQSAAAGSHHAMHARITNSVFLCWQDTDSPPDKET